MDQEQFENLNLEEQEKVLHESPLKERRDLLLRSHDPMRLTQSMSSEELYLMLREMDLEDRKEVLCFANLPQLLFVSDMECWQKDALSASGFMRWLETLCEADERRLLQWMLEIDYEAIVAGFQKIISVVKPETEYAADELLGDKPYFTLDNFYYISVKEENITLVKRVMEVLYENHRGKYVALLEGILSELENELEENAYLYRQTRLAERGFPEPETAYRIYSVISEEDFQKFPLKTKDLKKSDPGVRDVTDNRAPQYPVQRVGEASFFDQVLKSFNEEEYDELVQLQEEIAWLSNKIMAAEGINFFSEEKVRQAVERARAFVSIGLEILSEGDLLKAKKILLERWLEIVFRVGFTPLARLHKTLNEFLQEFWKKESLDFLSFLNPPYEFILRGLFQRIPQCYDSAVTQDLYHLRDFSKLSEIQSADIALKQVISVHEWASRNLKIKWHTLMTQEVTEETSLNLFSFLGTVFARFVLSKKLSFRSLSLDEIPKLIEKGFQSRNGKWALDSELKETFFEKHFTSKERLLSQTLWFLVWDLMEDECARLNLKEMIESRFLSSILVSEKHVKATSSTRKKKVR